MSRNLTKSTGNLLGYGAGAIGNLLNGAPKISVHVWGRADTFTTGATNNNRLLTVALDNSNSLFILAASDTGSGAIRAQFGARPTVGEAFPQTTGTTTIATGTWYAFGGVADFSGDRTRVYLNGTQESTQTPSWTATSVSMGSPTTAVDRIGCTTLSPTTALQWDGLIAHVAVWKRELTANQFLALARGVSPLAVEWADLVVYSPLWGIHSPEIDLTPNNKVATITGTVNAGTQDPPVMPYLHHVQWPSWWEEEVTAPSIFPPFPRPSLTLRAM